MTIFARRFHSGRRMHADLDGLNGRMIGHLGLCAALRVIDVPVENGVNDMAGGVNVGDIFSTLLSAAQAQRGVGGDLSAANTQETAALSRKIHEESSALSKEQAKQKNAVEMERMAYETEAAQNKLKVTANRLIADICIDGMKRASDISKGQ